MSLLYFDNQCYISFTVYTLPFAVLFFVPSIVDVQEVVQITVYSIWNAANTAYFAGM